MWLHAADVASAQASQGAMATPGVAPVQSSEPRRWEIETDTVNVQYSIARHLPVLVAGGGVKYSITSRWIFRVEARGQFTSNTLKILVNATPGTNAAELVNGSFAFATATDPSIQFSGINSTFFPLHSSLSGPPVRDFVAFEGRGIQRELSVTTGLAWRF